MSKAQATIERVEQEFNDFKKNTVEWNTAEDIFDRAYEIGIKQIAKDYIVNSIEMGTSNLAMYDRIEDILEWYYKFHMGSMDGTITEETVQEFEEYMVAELKTIAKEEQQAEGADDNRKVYHYSELSKEAKERAYGEALAYIEAEYANSDNQDIINNKEVHAKDEAENCAVYYEDGSFAELI